MLKSNARFQGFHTIKAIGLNLVIVLLYLVQESIVRTSDHHVVLLQSFCPRYIS